LVGGSFQNMRRVWINDVSGNIRSTFPQTYDWTRAEQTLAFIHTQCLADVIGGGFVAEPTLSHPTPPPNNVPAVASFWATNHVLHHGHVLFSNEQNCNINGCDFFSYSPGSIFLFTIAIKADFRNSVSVHCCFFFVAENNLMTFVSYIFYPERDLEKLATPVTRSNRAWTGAWQQRQPPAAPSGCG